MMQLSIWAMRTDRVAHADLAIIAPARLEHLMRMPKPDARARSIAAELLLCQAVRRYKPPYVPIPPVRSIGRYGKPYFAENPNFHFSISHAGHWAVFAHAPVPLGIDVEQIGENRPKVVQRFFHPDEQEWYASLPEEQQTKAFYRLWVLKESVVKSSGLGMHLPFSRFSVSIAPRLQAAGLPHPTSLFLLPFPDSYQLGGCVQTEEVVQPVLHICTPSFA